MRKVLNKKTGKLVGMKYDFNDTIFIASEFLRVLDCPAAREVERLLVQKEYDTLLNLELQDFVTDSTPEDEYRDTLLALSLLKKMPFRHPNLDPEKVGQQKFVEAELRCRETNELLVSPPIGSGISAILMHAQDVICEVLGEFSYDELVSKCKPGRRAAVNARGDLAHSVNHMAEMSFADPTGLLRCLLYDIVSMRGTALVEAVGSELGFVPKNGKTHRTVCIEPSLNMFVQQGLGEMIRDRLLVIGIDLTDQFHNQWLASLGAMPNTFSFSTLDLSSASDMIAWMLVRILFARLPEWLKWLSASRCQFTLTPDGRRLCLAKVSSMGNGFTFPLESLVFYSLTMAMARVNGNADCLDRHNLAIYGDDIVVPSEIAEQTIQVLEMFGFQINKEKSHVHGQYRESCGIHCLNHTKVRPLYLREVSFDVPELFRICNTILAQAIEEGSGLLANGRWRHAYRKIVRMLPSQYRENGFPPIKVERELYTVSITNSVLYDLKFPKLLRCPDGREGFLVKVMQPQTKFLFGYSAKSRLNVVTKQPGWELGAKRLMLHQVSQRQVEGNLPDRLMFHRNPEYLSMFANGWKTQGSGTGSSMNKYTVRTRTPVYTMASDPIFLPSTLVLGDVVWFDFQLPGTD